MTNIPKFYFFSNNLFESFLRHTFQIRKEQVLVLVLPLVLLLLCFCKATCILRFTTAEKTLYLTFQTKKDGSNEAPVSTAELLACREEVLKSRRFKIGLLSSSLLENPEVKSGNLKILLELMDESNPEVYITVRKLATVSLLEVFKDLLPSYHITQIQQEGVRCT